MVVMRNYCEREPKCLDEGAELFPGCSWELLLDGLVNVGELWECQKRGAWLYLAAENRCISQVLKSQKHQDSSILKTLSDNVECHACG
jgi:hypothetical protein